MATSERMLQAFQRFDDANSQDPNKETYEGKSYPKELLYAIRMTDTLKAFAPDASEHLQLTARCQHICRWEIPRESYEMDRAGYLKWRQDLKKFHVQRASVIMEAVGYEKETIDKVAFLLEKRKLKKNEETQVLEDVICLVFLQFYLEAFAEKHAEEKLLDILGKTWRKMSKRGREAALGLSLPKVSSQLITRAIQD